MEQQTSDILHKVYFVRHGQSTENQTRIHSDTDTELSELGREQARYVGERFSRIHIDLIVTSHLRRARETGKIIAAAIHKPIQESNLFQELVKPKEMVGQPFDSPEFEDIVRQWHAYWPLDESWQYSSEESFKDVKDRVLQARTHLEELPEKNILVVSHGLFTKAFMASLIFGPNMTWDTFRRLDRVLISKNTGITYFEHRERQKPQLNRFIVQEDILRDPDHNGWYLRAWNDHAHLG